MTDEPRPLYIVYRAGDHAVRCFRGVRNQPAQVADFLTFADLAPQVEWWDLPRAVGVSAWTAQEKAAAVAYNRGLPLLAEIDLSRADGRVSWAMTGKKGHVTIWAPALILIPAVVNYIVV